jgi:hypothetical protein
MKVSIILLAIVLTTISCKKERAKAVTPPAPFSNILILGNSITYSPPNLSIGWYGNWGMAASAIDSDYVHILTARFKQLNSNCKVSVENIAAFELGFTTFNLDSAFMTYKNTKPDLVIILIGEDVQAGFDTTLFDRKYAALVNYFKTANPNVKIFAAGSFWAGKDAVDSVMKKYSPFISLSHLSADPSTESYGLFTNPGIEPHPSDKGMREISNAMWTPLQTLNQ